MALRTRLHNYIESLKEEGVLDSQYDHVKSLQPDDDPCFLVDIINNFCNDADHSIGELANVLSEPIVDYAKVMTLVCLLKGSSSSIGGCRMAVACRQLHDASVNGDLANCCMAYDKLVNEYYYLRDKLKTVHQMERTIMHNEERKKK
ncbi:hypothetical protein MLD38_004073 [Melastoma candidum]|uniref:Uncharacterized protein n=1 Tax=Melastoma candidum TaxID=119954 RepID=A0ACB9S4G2_9MYRT|nr:hypothetical protein MLD38_004073 [Melastoma candidum]